MPEQMEVDAASNRSPEPRQEDETQQVPASPPHTPKPPSPPPSASANAVPQKRKSPPSESGSADAQGESADEDQEIPKDEYEAGQVICQTCGQGVSFRDDASGGFTLKHWDAHRQKCATTMQAPPEPVIYTPESTAEALANPPPKRRRAKRTEEERIDYLRSDPYVAEFEAYRVLCASCDKWIRLRPNSTYCSIPWDAHRKSCLSKKINKNVYGLAERNSILAKDPDVRKFDAERILCNSCDTWIGVSSSNHMQAVQQWLSHRTSCKKSLPDRNAASSSKSEGGAHSRATDSADAMTPGANGKLGGDPESPSSSFKDLNPGNFPPAHESRRRNAEQRASTLRADPYVGEVEPNRVFCKLCRKWVQLRQDSSYCAYPWLQHRGKCLIRHERKAQKAAQLEAKMHGGASGSRLSHDDGMSDGSEDELESEDGMIDGAEDADGGSASSVHYRKRAKKPRLDGPSAVSGGGGWAAEGSASSRGGARGGARGAKGKFAEIPVADVPPGASRLMRRLNIGFAELNSAPGRTNFIFSSIAYLFMTTYEPSDDMTISSLLTYLNTTIPPDKYEDFDTTEVVKAAAALQERGDIVFEGDTLRLLE
ncbi:hypothetical protein CONPUDRAFT_169667 [Coniophora puteana RWD-64-598 SS2]|uniref:Uncharacterized protein n=1 Tax=Coniophora puteana (strain RWD-64-598) TaxID=741705 RepID=A0A5M3M8D1_CONPW|nr:uncharacterized protein CONPUDRAFT_169667 [Coniophora puteana RWD-64-598 SS2]EIW75303.1 hypothetical protein CONPUDRAFT_169667 [Coniophora puteana RWD-64-598 SS2]